MNENLKISPNFEERRVREYRDSAGDRINDAFYEVGRALRDVGQLKRLDSPEITKEVHNDSHDYLLEVHRKLEDLLCRYEKLGNASEVEQILDNPLLENYWGRSINKRIVRLSEEGSP